MHRTILPHLAPILALTLLTLTGCRDAGKPQLDPGVFVGETQKQIPEMKGDEIIVAVNAAALTRLRFDQALALQETLYKLRNPNATSVEAKFFMRNIGRSIINDFVSRQLLFQEATHKKISVLPDARVIAENGVNAIATRQKKTLEQFYVSLGENGTLLKTMVAEDALIHSLHLAQHADRLRVTDADIDARLAELTAYNDMCIATNKLVMAKGRELYEQLKADADFATLAREASAFNDEEPDGDWGVFYPHEIEDPNVRKAAFDLLPVGGISEPLDTEEGLVIIKVLEREGAGADSVVTLNALRAHLARIVLPLADGGADYTLPSRDEVRKYLERQRLMTVQHETLRPLRAAAHIEYPNGTNFWSKAK